MNYEPSAPIPLLYYDKIISLSSSIDSYSFSPPEVPLEKTPPEQESQKSMVKVPVPLPWLALVACVLASSIPADSIATVSPFSFITLLNFNLRNFEKESSQLVSALRPITSDSFVNHM